MVLFHFGWAKPVPINPNNFKNPKKGFAISALAGPVANLIVAFFTAFLYLFVYALLKDVNFESKLTLQIVQNSIDFIFILHSINIGLAIFNLIPIPPLDGSRILNVVLPPKTYFKIMRYERYILIGVLALTFLSSRFFNISPASWVADKLFGLIENAIYSLLNLTF
jgi:Zn-dependent protease